MNAQPMMSSIQNLFEQSCVDLFHSFDCNAEPINDHGTPDLLGAPIATISAGSHELKVDIFLQIPYTTLTLTYPVAADIYDVRDEDLEDFF